MKKRVIGYIFGDKNLGKDEKVFIKLAKKKNISLIFFNIYKDFNELDIRKKIKKCDIIFNNSAEPFAVEIIKTIEEMGKKVIDSSKSHFYIQDKWMFYLECRKKNIPTPRTILLSESFNIIKKQLNEFNTWPVVLKRTDGSCGENIEKAENVNEAIEIIKRFYGNSEDRYPIIAQEFILSDSYRITLIDNKIIQTAEKVGSNWKKTGVNSKHNKNFKVDNGLKKIIDQVMKFVDIKICGIDFINNNNKWLVLEINSEPAFDFFPEKREKVINQVINFLVKEMK